MSKTIRIAVIMAGGTGERFWPLSRKQRPKQLLNLTAPDQTLLAEAIARLTPLIPLEHILVVTGRHLVDPIRQALPNLPPENVIAEPCKRNTAGCLAFATATVLNRFDPDPAHLLMAVVTADHQIGNPERFRAAVAAALDAAEQQPVLVTIGIKPVRPETGYGYIEIPEKASPLYQSAENVRVYPVARFREKPDAAMAEQFVAAGRFFWNSGMFFWRVSNFLAELNGASPVLGKAVSAMTAVLGAGKNAELETIFSGLEDISIDYALMEKARQVAMVKGDFPWDDIGAWDALDRTFPRDPNGNVAIGDPVLIDACNSIVYNEPGADAMAVGVIGADNLVVVVTRDAVLVVPKNRVQEVKKIMAELKRRNASQL